MANFSALFLVNAAFSFASALICAIFLAEI